MINRTGLFIGLRNEQTAFGIEAATEEEIHVHTPRVMVWNCAEVPSVRQFISFNIKIACVCLVLASFVTFLMSTSQNYTN